MSTYIGTGNSGKKQLHLTDSNFSLSTMKGGPRQGTTFHSDLPYITVLDTIHTWESSSRRNLAKSYIDQGYVVKRILKIYARGGESWMPGSTAVFRTTVSNTAPPTDRVTNFRCFTQINPAYGAYGGNRDFGPTAWGPANSPGAQEGSYLWTEGKNSYIDFSVGYSGSYTQGQDSFGHIELLSGMSGRDDRGSATIRGTDPDYNSLNTQSSRYNPWTGSKTDGAHYDFMILNIKKSGSTYQYTNQNNDPGSAGILINKNDITVGSNYSMRNTPMLADLGTGQGLIYWNSSQGKYYLSVDYMRSNVPIANSPLWNFFNDVFKVGTTYTPQMDEVAHIMRDMWIFVNDANTIVGWQIKPSYEDCLVTIDPARLLGTGSGVELTNDTIKMYGTSGKQLTIASPTTELLQVPADPVLAVAPAITNIDYNSIRSGMYPLYTYTSPNDTWQNLGDPQTLWTRSEDIGYAPFPPSIKGGVDSCRLILDYKWGSGLLRVSGRGYDSYQNVDHKITHSPMNVFRMFRTPGVVTKVMDLADYDFLASEIALSSEGATTFPSNSSSNKMEGVSCTYSLYADWDNKRFVIRRTWTAQSGNFAWRFFSYNKWLNSKVYAYSNGEILYSIPECRVSIYVLSATDNDFTINTP